METDIIASVVYETAMILQNLQNIVRDASLGPTSDMSQN